jgi:hypothetical protein
LGGLTLIGKERNMEDLIRDMQSKGLIEIAKPHLISEFTKWLICKYLWMEHIQNCIPYKETWFYWLEYGKVHRN